MTNDLDNVDFISSNVNSSRQEALLYVFEDSEAVIKMTMKGMRHVSRTHRVAFDLLFDRINLEPQIKIKYIASQMLNSSLSMLRVAEQDNGHSLGLDQRKSGTLSVKTVHKENGTKSLRK